MRVFLVGVALTLAASQAAFAAIEYEFVQTSRAVTGTGSSSDFTARAVIDGGRTRVEFRTGNAYPPGTYVISNDGARRLQFVDPAEKTYTEVNTIGIVSAVGSSNIQIENFKQETIAVGDTQTIAGIVADHNKQIITYDITVRFGTMPLKQAVRTEIDRWTTPKFGQVTDAFLAANALTTGNAAIDDLIRNETTKSKGFPLKQTIRISTTDLSANKRSSNSQLKLPVTKTRTRELTVTSIRETPAQDSWFTVPADFKRVDYTERVTKSQTQVLSMEPASE
jgi:hypothetical protein